MGWLELTGVALGVAYLWLEYHANIWLWVVSVAMPAVYLGVYWQAGLYADFAISIYYIAASLYGLWHWLRPRHNSVKDTPGTITSTPLRMWPRLAAATLLLWLALGLLLARFTDSNVPWADAATTALSITAMWMLSRRYSQQWLVWLAADIGCSALYLYKDLWPTAFLYAAYAVVAWFGWRKWQKMAKKQPQ